MENCVAQGDVKMLVLYMQTYLYKRGNLNGCVRRRTCVAQGDVKMLVLYMQFYLYKRGNLNGLT